MPATRIHNHHPTAPELLPPRLGGGFLGPERARTVRLPIGDVVREFGGPMGIPATITLRDLGADESTVDLPTSTPDFENSVSTRTNTPPGMPAVGARVLVLTAPVGAFVGFANNVAEWSGTAWTFVPPQDGLHVFVEDEDADYVYTQPANAWTRGTLPAAHAATHEQGAGDPIASLPTAAEKAALPGTNGTPGAANRYVVETDGRVARVEQTAVAQTTNATPTVLWTRTLDDNRVYAFRLTVTARRTDSLGSAIYERVFRARRASGGAAVILGNTFIPFPDHEDDAAWDVTIDTSANQVRALVTGVAGGTIRWSAEVEFHSVT